MYQSQHLENTTKIYNYCESYTKWIKKKWNKIAICQNVIYYNQSRNNQTTYNFVLLYLSRTSFIPQENLCVGSTRNERQRRLEKVMWSSFKNVVCITLLRETILQDAVFFLTSLKSLDTSNILKLCERRPFEHIAMVGK